MKFRDFSKANLADIPKIDMADIRLLWHSDYYDGPRSGLLVYQGQKYWFENPSQAKEEDDGFFTRFVLMIALTPKQLATEEAWHELFRQKVGLHTDYDEDGKRPLGKTHPRESWHEFYDAYQNYTLDLADNEIIGWFPTRT